MPCRQTCAAALRLPSSSDLQLAHRVDGGGRGPAERCVVDWSVCVDAVCVRVCVSVASAGLAGLRRRAV